MIPIPKVLMGYSYWQTVMGVMGYAHDPVPGKDFKGLNITKRRTIGNSDAGNKSRFPKKSKSFLKAMTLLPLQWVC